MLLSVIIPAYNAVWYLPACLGSVFALPLAEDEMEVLVIDDGSTDETPQLLESWRAEHRNLRCFRQLNQGQSVARNLGIDKAQGEYIFFVDADDALTQPCPLPVEAMRAGKYDIIGMETLVEETDGTQHRYCHQIFPVDRDFATGRDYLRDHNVLGIVYGYLFRTCFVQEHPQLRFTPGIYHQDEEFVVKAFCLGGAFVYQAGYTYIYVTREGSSIHTFTQERKERLMSDTMTVMQRLMDFGTADVDVRNAMRCKMGWMTFDVFKLLVLQHHTLRFSWQVSRRLAAMGAIPALLRSLPYIVRYRYDQHHRSRI